VDIVAPQPARAQSYIKRLEVVLTGGLAFATLLTPTVAPALGRSLAQARPGEGERI
jgi:hypothetical protein